jgi:dTDP-4-amino-4,6-dideoxygalactose transaminase
MKRRDAMLPFALPEVGKEEMEAVAEVIASGWLTTGPKTKLFEQQFARYVGARFAVAVNSCTAAMHLSLEACGVGAGDFVITTPYTFAATAEVIRYFDAIPVFVDVEPDTLNLSPKAFAATVQELQSCLMDGRRPETPAVARALGGSPGGRGLSRTERPARIRAVIPVHMAGHPCDMDAITDIARQHDLAVLEDAAHACSAAYKGRPVGSAVAGDVPWAASFSFYATKTLATGEGGMITTDSEEWADRLRVMSLHGISKDAWKRYTAEGSWYYEITAPGFKYNMADLIAAVGLVQLRKVDRMRQRREEIANRYNEAFAPYAELEIPTLRDGIGHAWHLYMLRLNDDASGLGRDQFITRLKDRQVSSSVHFIPLHIHPYYRSTYGYQPDDLPVAVREYKREVSLPIYSGMTDVDVQSVIDAVVDILHSHRTEFSQCAPSTSA